MRKLKLRTDGTIDLFSRLHERNGWYIATSPEGSGNVGLRLQQLAGIATQLGLFTWDNGPVVTAGGEHLLGVPR